MDQLFAFIYLLLTFIKVDCSDLNILEVPLPPTPEQTQAIGDHSLADYTTFKNRHRFELREVRGDGTKEQPAIYEPTIEDLSCNETSLAATLILPKSFVIQPEFNDLIEANPNARRECKITEVKYRLYPTYRIVANSQRLCGITKLGHDEWEGGINDSNNYINHHLDGRHRRRSKGHGTNHAQDDGDDDYYERQSSAATKTTKLLMHMRFPVIKSLRTTEDTYATLVCSLPATSFAPPGTSIIGRDEFGEKRRQQQLDDLGDILYDVNKDMSANSSRSASDDLEEPIVEESRRQQTATIQPVRQQRNGSVVVVQPSDGDNHAAARNQTRLSPSHLTNPIVGSDGQIELMTKEASGGFKQTTKSNDDAARSDSGQPVDGSDGLSNDDDDDGNFRRSSLAPMNRTRQTMASIHESEATHVTNFKINNSAADDRRHGGFFERHSISVHKSVDNESAGNKQIAAPPTTTTALLSSTENALASWPSSANVSATSNSSGAGSKTLAQPLPANGKTAAERDNHFSLFLITVALSLLILALIIMILIEDVSSSL